MGKAAARRQRAQQKAGSASRADEVRAGAPVQSAAEAFEREGRRVLADGAVTAAIEAFARAVAAGSTSADVSNDLGVLLAQQGRLGVAVVHLEMAVALGPGRPELRNNLLKVLEELASASSREGRAADTAVLYARLAALDPDCVAFLVAAGSAWRAARRPREALPHFIRARALAPQDARVRFGLGSTWLDLDQEEAEGELQKAIALDPTHVDALVNLALISSRLGRVEEARRLNERALALAPEHPEAHGNLAGLLREQGEIAASLAHFHRAAELRPDAPLYASGTLLAMQGSPDVSPEALVAAHRAWNERFARPVDPGPRLFAERGRDPERRLRVGYVSADMRNHAVAAFVEPLFAAHARGAFEVVAYSDGAPDEVTGRLRAAADLWRDTRPASDAALAAQIEADRVDVLVDLNGHTGGNRLLVFARRAAPVQVTYCGYPGTTGVAAIDWRLTDATADPPGAADTAATERLWRLPHGFLCFRPAVDAGEVGPLPALGRGRVTFGSFNNLAKVNERVLDCWARLLLAVPESELLLKSRALSDATPAARMRALFEGRGVDPARIVVAPYAASSAEHVGLYRRVDVGLDPFPYNGTTTTCEALWMGVPVVTLAGDTHAGRVGASLLSRVGLEDLVAHSIDAYVGVAAGLATDLPALARLRDDLRARVAASPLVSGPTIARDIEAAFRAMWREFCARPAG